MFPASLLKKVPQLWAKGAFTMAGSGIQCGNRFYILYFKCQRSIAAANPDAAQATPRLQTGSGYFGKYLNQYDGSNIPPGWNEWYVSLKNSRYYNYTVNNNGRFERKAWNYEKDYSTNVFADAAIRFFRRAKIRDYTKPVLMTVSFAAPHGSEDPAPHHSSMLKNAKAPRHPSFNSSFADKHWIVRQSPPISPPKEQFIDLLHRRRLLTLLSLDDAIARLYQTVRRMGQLENTYIFFTSDHGYHLGQFRLVKGKSQPYETDIRVPMYVVGPGVPVNKTEAAIALNIDLVPTFLDIAGVNQPENVDGSSLLNVISAKKKKRRRNMRGMPLTPWRDTFLVERTRMAFLPALPYSHQVIQRQKISRLDPFTQLYARFKVNSKDPSGHYALIYCTKKGAPQPPCSPRKKRVCALVNGKYSLIECQSKKRSNRKDKKDLKCTCKSVPKPKPTVPPLDEILPTADLDKRPYYQEYYRKLRELADLHGEEATIFAKLLVRMKRKSRKRSLRRLTIRDLKYNEIHLRIREAKKLLGALRQRRRLLKNSDTKSEKKSSEVKADEKCTCRKEKGKGKKKQAKSMLPGINCFFVNRAKTWVTPPRWTGSSFVSCTNTANNSYLCLRTINATHNFIYCKFVTGFIEYYDLNKDPYQVKNTHRSLSNDAIADFDRQIDFLSNCKGERQCTVTAGRRPNVIVRPAIRRNFVRSRYPRARYFNWNRYLGISQ
eukprot:gene8681-14701_t